MQLKSTAAVERLRTAIRDVPNFPVEGVVFKDITPILQDGQLFRLMITLLAERYKRMQVDQLVAIDARGFLIASALAYNLGTGVSIVRKKGKLPWNTIAASYDLEYGSNTIEMHTDAIEPGQKVVVIDDVLATGGTMAATLDLIRKLGGEVVEAGFFIELCFLDGRKKLPNTPIHAVIQY